MLPYNASFLRCHASWLQVTDPDLHHSTRIGSNTKIQWRCSECNREFMSSPHTIMQSTGRCKPCSTKLQNTKRFYNGTIPIELRCILRAAVMHDMKENDIIENINRISVSYFQQHDVKHWIDQMKSFDKADLLNNRFWKRDYVKWMTTKKRPNDNEKNNNENKKAKKHENRQHSSSKGDHLHTMTFAKDAKIQKRCNLFLSFIFYFECHCSTQTIVDHWLPDYAYWAPVVRMARHNMDCMVELWLGYIHPRLFLPTELFIVPMKAVDEDYKWQCAIRLLYSLSICLSMFYEVPKTEARGERAVKFELFYSTLFVRLRRESVGFCLNDMEHSKSIIHMLLWTSSYFGQIIDWPIIILFTEHMPGRVSLIFSCFCCLFFPLLTFNLYPQN